MATLSTKDKKAFKERHYPLVAFKSEGGARPPSEDVVVDSDGDDDNHVDMDVEVLPAPAPAPPDAPMISIF